MSDAVLADNVPAMSAIAVNHEHQLAKQSAELAVQHAVRCGQLLADVKAALRHGEFGPWIEANCEFKYSTAVRYMKAAKQISTAVEISSLRHLFPSGRSMNKPDTTPIDKTNAPETPPVAAVNRAPREQRIKQIGELAARGNNSRQIAKHIGLGVHRVRGIAKEAGVVLPDAIIGKAGLPDYRRIVVTTVDTMIGAAQGLDVIASAECTLTPEEAGDLAKDLAIALKKLSWLKRRLQEQSHE